MEVTFRGVRERDFESLLRWRNDPETRKNSLTDREITREEHTLWFARAIGPGVQRNRIADIDGMSVGVVRFDWTENRDGCDLSFTVAPEHRGKGYGFAMVEHALKNMHGRVCAEVKMSNQASRRILEKLNFHTIDSQGEILMYARDFPLAQQLCG